VFLISGCQRSGTTLLGLALQAHKDITLFEEDQSRFQERVGETLLLKFPACLEYDAQNPQLIGFKAPRDSHRLLRLIESKPDLKTLWLHRSALQVAASMVSLNINGVSWAMGWAPREIRKYLTAFDDPALTQDFSHAQALGNDRAKELAFAALCWRAKAAQFKYYQTHIPDNLIRIDYDELVQTPRSTLTRITAYLDLDWDENLLKHSDVLAPEMRPGETSTQRPIDGSSLDKWRSHLTPADQDIITRYKGEY